MDWVVEIATRIGIPSETEAIEVPVFSVYTWSYIGGQRPFKWEFQHAKYISNECGLCKESENENMLAAVSQIDGTELFSNKFMSLLLSTR